jgi:uncharacterized tellurite resistance protein B-like protein
MLRFLGLGDRSGSSGASADAAETATVRRIVAELQTLDPEQRRYLAGFAYVLSRAANADLTVTPEEARLMEQIVAQIGGLPDAQAVLVVEIARNQNELYGGTEDFLVTREFAAHASAEQRHAVVEACFAIAAADGTITSDEMAELTQIAKELDLAHEELNEIRRGHADQLAAIKLMRGAGLPGSGSGQTG